VHSFERAAELDPKSPMPQWGIALARGPNFNAARISAAREALGYYAIRHAEALAASAPPEEKAYVAALAQRFSPDAYAPRAPLARAYAQAMRRLWEAYPSDPDAGALYAESLMDLHAWRLWTPAGLPGPDTDEILLVLRGVLRRWPDHIGANHYLVHALEASPHPRQALASARRLARLAPAAGHLVHMPAHIYMRIGDYAAAVRATLAAAAADRRYMDEKTILNAGYVRGYAEHNLQFLATAAAMDGQEAVATRAAQRLGAMAGEGPEGQAYRSIGYFVLVRFAEWRRVLAMPAPALGLALQSFFWRYARGCALAGLGQPARARGDFVDMELAAAGGIIPARVPALGRWAMVRALAAGDLLARIAEAQGDLRAAIAQWRAAIAVQDAMPYHEPPSWYPMRESLGAALLRAGEARKAEAAYRQDLRHNPDNPRSLLGLARALDALGRPAAARRVRRAYLEAWRGREPRQVASQ
jgi:tetratricopeptide (TPR) repeat protein